MAKGVYIGVGGAAKKVKQIYIGVNGQAKKVKKGYIGVNGQAKLFWSALDITYDGKHTSNLTYSPFGASASNWYHPDYAPDVVFIAGGRTGSSLSTAVRTVNYIRTNTLTISTPSSYLNTAGSELVGGNSKNYFYSMGGKGTNGINQKYVDIYNNANGSRMGSFTSWAPYGGCVCGPAGASIVYGGGAYSEGYTSEYATTMMYSTEYNSMSSSSSPLPTGLYGAKHAACNEDVFFIAGGKNSSGNVQNTVYMYRDKSLIGSTSQGLTLANYIGLPIGVSTYDYAYFIDKSSQRFNKDGTKQSLSNPQSSATHNYGAGSGCGSWCVVCGGENASGAKTNLTSIWNSEGTTQLSDSSYNLFEVKDQLAMTHTENRIIVAGGCNNSGNGLSTIELFTAEG